MKKSFLLLMVIIFCSTLIGCKTTEPLSPMQKRQITTRVIDGGFDNIFAASITVLQDNEYIIKDAKKDTGLITAEVNRDSDLFSKLLTTSKYGITSNQGTKVELSALVDKISSSNSEIRITIQEITYSNNGGTTSSSQIYDPKVYEKIFDSIKVEVKRREAFNR